MRRLGLWLAPLAGLVLAVLLGLGAGTVGNDGEAVSATVVMLLACAWPLAVRKFRLLRFVLPILFAAALWWGMTESPCGRDGSSSGGEMCLGRCEHSLGVLKTDVAMAGSVHIGPFTRGLFALTCLDTYPLRVP